VERHGGLGREAAQVLVDLVAAESPAAHVRVVLAHHRRCGRPFNEAWASALRSIPRNDEQLPEYRAALRATKNVWRRAYEQSSDLLVA
jgi:hypothetical protein